MYPFTNASQCYFCNFRLIFSFELLTGLNILIFHDIPVSFLQGYPASSRMAIWPMTLFCMSCPLFNWDLIIEIFPANVRGYLRRSMSDFRRNYFCLGGGGQRQFHLSSDIDFFALVILTPNQFVDKENDSIMIFLSTYF